MKAGYKTTEFWVTIVIQFMGILATMGYLTPEQSDAVTQGLIQLGGLVAMVASAFGYNIARGNAKKSNGQSGGCELLFVMLLFALVGFMIQFQGCTKNLQLQDPRTMSVQDLRLVATKTYNDMYDYHVMKSGMAGLTQQEKETLNELKWGLAAVRGPLREFQLLVDGGMNPSVELRTKILLFLDHWMYKQLE